MMRPEVYAIDGVIPVVHPEAFVHPTAVLIGDVIVGPRCYIGPFASLRGDFGSIRVEAGANIQDGCTLHSFPGQEAVVEEDGHIGHGAILHGCRVGKNALIGMNAVVMDGVTVGENAIVAAHSFVKAGADIPAGTLAAGSPARTIRTLSADEITWKSQGTAEYQRLAERSRKTMVRCAPLEEVEENRPKVDAGDTQPLYKVKKG